MEIVEKGAHTPAHAGIFQARSIPVTACWNWLPIVSVSLPGRIPASSRLPAQLLILTAAWMGGILKRTAVPVPCYSGYRDDARLKNPGGGSYWKELLDRIRNIRTSKNVLYRQVLDKYATLKIGKARIKEPAPQTESRLQLLRQ